MDSNSALTQDATPVWGYNTESELDRSWVISASQLESFTQCQRKWAWEKIGGFKDGGSDATDLGGRVHKILEDYLEHGILPDQSTREGEIATAGLHLIPAPKTPGMTVEFSFKFSSPRGNLFTGRKDYTVRPIQAWDPHGIVKVGDHKTTVDFKWAKDEETLRTNIQATIYAADELLRTGGEAVDLEWVYYRTRGAAQAKRVSLRIWVPEVEKNFQAIDDMADQIHRVRATVDKDHILDLPPTMDSCNLFNKPCPHLFRCNFSPAGRLAAVMASQGKDLPVMSNLPQPTNDLMVRLAQQAQAPTAPTGAPAAPGAPSALDAMRARMGGAPPGPPAYQPPPALPPMVAPQAAAPAQVYQPPPSPPTFQAPPMAAPAPAAYQPPPAPPPPAAFQAPVAPGHTWVGGPGGQWVADAPAPPPPAAPPMLPPMSLNGAPTPPPSPVPPGTPTAPPPPATTWYTDSGMNIYSCVCGLQVSDGVLAQHQGKCPRCGTQAENFPSFLFQAPVNPPEQALPVPVNAATNPGQAAPPPPPMPTPANPGPQAVQAGAPSISNGQAPQVDTGKRKRRTKAEMEAARAAQAAAATPGHVLTPAQHAAIGAGGDDGGAPIRRLLIDALPIGRHCDTAEEAIFAPARAMVKQAMGVDDYRQIDFGKGPGVFASAVLSILEAGQWETMYVDSRSADAMHVISILTANADETIRGMA